MVGGLLQGLDEVLPVLRIYAPQGAFPDVLERDNHESDNDKGGNGYLKW